MSNVWRAKIPNSSSFQEHSESNIAENLSGSCYDPNHGLGDDEDPLHAADADDEENNIQVIQHEDFMRSDRGGALLNPGDEGYDEEMGAESQMLQDEYMMKEYSKSTRDEKALLNGINDSVQNAKNDLDTDLWIPEDSDTFIADSRGEEGIGSESSAGSSDEIENKIAVKGIKLTKRRKNLAQEVVDEKREKQASRQSKATSGSLTSSSHYVFAAPSFNKKNERSFSSSRHLAIPSYLKQKRK